LETLESLRGSIESAEEMHSVVRTMRSMAAVEIRQFQVAGAAVAEYNRTVEMGLQILLRSKAEEVRITLPEATRRLGVIVFGSDQGMVGQFNQRIVDYAIDEIAGLPAADQDHQVLAVGLRAAVRLEQAGQPVAGSLRVPSSVHGITPTVRDLLVQIDKWRRQRGIEHILLFYNTPRSGAAYEPVSVQLWPVDAQWLEELRQREWPTRVLPTFRMDWGNLLSALLQHHFFVILFRAVAESKASENASRLASMQSAEENIEERLKELNSQYHRLRQTSITEELLDLVAGFEALGGGQI
jgi:F-type H+-transporting ATPase subunit gamma